MPRLIKDVDVLIHTSHVLPDPLINSVPLRVEPFWRACEEVLNR